MITALVRDITQFLIAGAIALVALSFLGLPVPNVLGFLALYTLLSFVAGFVVFAVGVAFVVLLALARR